MEHEADHSRGGLAEVLGMAAPIVFGSLSFVLMGFVDAAMVSWLGEDPVAAVPVAGLWVFTFSTFVLGVMGCVATFVSQSLGRGEREDCARYAWQGIYLALASGLIGLILWPFSGTIFDLMPHSDEVRHLETTYFQVRMAGFVFISWQAALTSFFQAVNRPLVPTFVAWFAVVLNVPLDYLLIFGKFGFPRWEIRGAAAATVIALAVQVALMQAVFLSRRLDSEFGTRRANRLDMPRIRELLRIGWPGGLAFFADVFNWAIFTSIVVGMFGAAQLAAHNIALQFMHISFMPAVGLNHAVTPIVGQWIGRGSVATAKARTYTALKLAIPYMVTLGVIFAVFGSFLIRIFFRQDPGVIRLGHRLLILAAIFQGFDAVNIITMGALRGAGDTRFMMRALLIAGYGFFLPIAWSLAVFCHLEAVGAWIGATIYVIGLSGVLFWRFHWEGWRHITIFERDRIDS